MHVIKGQRRRLYKAALAPQKENGIKKQPLSFWTVPRPTDEKKKNPVEEQNHFKRSCPEIQAG